MRLFRGRGEARGKRLSVRNYFPISAPAPVPSLPLALCVFSQVENVPKRPAPLSPSGTARVSHSASGRGPGPPGSLAPDLSAQSDTVLRPPVLSCPGSLAIAVRLRLGPPETGLDRFPGPRWICASWRPLRLPTPLGRTTLERVSRTEGC